MMSPVSLCRPTSHLTRRFRLALAAGLAGLAAALPAQAAPRPLLLISIDGLRPDYISEADKHGLKIPALRELHARGARASGVRGVLPTATYPSHTTVITGVAPARHGIIANHPFGVEREGLDIWYYYAEEIEVPTLWDAATAAGRVVGSVSWPVNGFCYLDAALVRAGLITLESTGKSIREAGVSQWVARTWTAGGSAAVVLRQPDDAAAHARVRKVLDELAANPDNGIARILDAEQIRAAGGAPTARFWVDMRPGFQIHPALDAAPLAPTITVAVSGRGAHGYAPDHPEMYSTFVLSGAGIQEGRDLAVIDMRSIAPTLAKVMGIDFPSNEAPALDVLASSAR